MNKPVALLSCQKPLGFFDTPQSAKIDPFGEDKLLIDAFQKRGIEARRLAWDDATVNWGDFECAIVRSTWDYFVRCEEFLKTLTMISSQTRLMNSLDTIRWNSNKRYLGDLEKRGVPIVPTIYLQETTVAATYEAARSKKWDRFVVKPVIGGGALETYRLPKDEAIFQKLNTKHSPEFMVQPYLDSIEREGEWSFLFFGGEFQFAIQKVPVEGDYRVQAIFGATTTVKTPSEADLMAAKKVLQTVPEKLLFARVDMVRAEGGGLWLMELELIEPFLSLGLQASAAESLVESFLSLRGRA